MSFFLHMEGKYPLHPPEEEAHVKREGWVLASLKKYPLHPPEEEAHGRPHERAVLPR